jgi:hypothetical protein
VLLWEGEQILNPTPQGPRQTQCDERIGYILPCLNGIDGLARQPTAGCQGLLAQARRLPSLAQTII